MCFSSLDTALVFAENRSFVTSESEMTDLQGEESIPVENDSSIESDSESALEPNENTSTEESSTDNIAVSYTHLHYEGRADNYQSH